MFLSTFLCYIFLLPIVFCIYESDYPEKPLYKSLKQLSTNETDYILPTNLKPSLYELIISPDFSNNSFSGIIQITFDVLNATDVIVLHLNNDSLTLLDVVLTNNHENATVNLTSFDAIHEFVKFQLSTSLSVQNNVMIKIIFSGRLGNDMLGFYLSTYSTASANHSMAVTQFESTYARRAFPCFDEPKYRARFSISIIRLANMTSMSNMELKSSRPDNDGMVQDEYNTTPLMPTYLVAFGVSDLFNVTDGKKFRVFAREAVIQESAYTVSVGQKILDKIESFVGVPYPLEKMDVVAVPDFSAGAMENWGLTTYREKYVLYNPVFNTWKDKFGVLSVIAHEFGHQWFGDLVTPEWWDVSWLNEAFATYFEYITSSQVEPGWNMGSAPYVMWSVQYALAKDIGTPRPMTAPVYTPAQISNVFDYVIYEKGGSILRMTENFLTTPVWQAGLKQYLTNNEYKTGTPDELFSALQSQSTEITHVNETLLGWTTQPGYPLINVTCTNGTNNSSVLVCQITQSPYAMNGSYTWNVPLTYTTQSEQQFDATKASKHWLMPSLPETSLISINETGWVIFNIDQVGFYRVNYDANNWAKLRSQLAANFSAISSINRAQIVDDAFHLGRTGHLDFHKVIGLTRYLSMETEIAPWNAFIINMKFLMDQFEGTSTGDALKQYSQSVISAPFKSLAVNLTQALSSFSGALTVQSALSFACDVGLPACESLALYEFELWRRNITNHTIIPELKQAVLCTGLRKDQSINAFNDVWGYYLQSNNGAEKLVLMNALGCVSSGTALSVYLDSVCNTNATYVRLQDRWIVFRALISQQANVSPVLHYMANKFDTVSVALGYDIYRVMDSLANAVSQQDIPLVVSLSNDPAVNTTLKDMLNSIVLPAVNKRQNWLQSQSASSIKSWAHCYLSSSANPPVFSVYLIIAAVVALVNFTF